MSDFDPIVDRAREIAGADFAFVLTQIRLGVAALDPDELPAVEPFSKER